MWAGWQSGLVVEATGGNYRGFADTGLTSGQWEGVGAKRLTGLIIADRRLLVNTCKQYCMIYVRVLTGTKRPILTTRHRLLTDNIPTTYRQPDDELAAGQQFAGGGRTRLPLVVGWTL